MFGTHMKEHALGAVILVIVAVHAVVLVLIEVAVIFVNGFDVETLQIALIESELPVKFVGGLNQTIRQIAVDGFLGHLDGIGRKLNPSRFALGIKRYVQLLSLGSLQQVFPLQRVELQFAIVSCCCQHFASGSLDLCHVCLGLIGDLQVERSYIGGHHDVAVIGKNVSRLVHSRAVARHFGFGRSGATGQTQGQR